MSNANGSNGETPWHVRIVQFFLAGCAAIGIGAAPRQPTPPLDAPLEVVTSPNVDERLFLLRALETMYERRPIGVEDPRQLQAAIGELRHEANRHHQYIIAQEFVVDRKARSYRCGRRHEHRPDFWSDNRETAPMKTLENNGALLWALL
jgi:hypothetical protein